ncbi:MAG TPA: serine/threonine-protein kinase [Kofleriaceae bacterium]|nr:serine/threonine-protein kinase [Kofleriaceae bacterium]
MPTPRAGAAVKAAGDRRCGHADSRISHGIAAARLCRVTRRRDLARTIPANAALRLDGAELAGHAVISRIARGGTSTVYLAEQVATGERVAIKALDPFFVGHADMVHRLLDEHALARRARHPGLLEIRCAEQTHEGIPYLVMEYLEGESLGALAGRRAIPGAAIAPIAAQIARALAALHAAGVVHCDLKLDNVLVLEDPARPGGPRIKVIDYSVARLVDDPPLPDGAVAGTPSVMAPEQWLGAPAPASDVYALGCVLYELVTGGPVFTGALPQLMTAHTERLPDRPSTRCPDLDPRLERLIVRALAKDPALRPTMADLAAELDRLAAASALHPREVEDRRLEAAG